MKSKQIKREIWRAQKNTKKSQNIRRNGRFVLQKDNLLNIVSKVLLCLNISLSLESIENVHIPASLAIPFFTSFVLPFSSLLSLLLFVDRHDAQNVYATDVFLPVVFHSTEFSMEGEAKNSTVLIILFPLLAGGLLLALTGLLFLRRLQRRRHDQKYEGTVTVTA